MVKLNIYNIYYNNNCLNQDQLLYKMVLTLIIYMNIYFLLNNIIITSGSSFFQGGKPYLSSPVSLRRGKLCILISKFLHKQIMFTSSELSDSTELRRVMLFLFFCLQGYLVPFLSSPLLRLYPKPVDQIYL